MTSTAPIAVGGGHAAVCAALASSTPVIADIVAGADMNRRPHRMSWTNAEIALHLALTASELTKAARGESYCGEDGPSAATDEALVATCAERDPKVIADLIRENLGTFLATVTSMDPTTPVKGGSLPWNSGATTVGVLASLLTLDHPLHGGQIAETAGKTWTEPPTGLPAALGTVMPWVFNPAAAEGVNARYSFRFRGTEPFRFAVDNGVLTVGGDGPVDCRVTADPETFVRLGIGVVSQGRAILTGKMVATGRKPWLATAIKRVFPDVPHGGVAGR